MVRLRWYFIRCLTLSLVLAGCAGEATTTTIAPIASEVVSTQPAPATEVVANPTEVSAPTEAAATEVPAPTEAPALPEMPDAPDSSTVRFLHVLEGADSGASAQPTTIIRSSAGTAYEGAAVAGAVVMFPLNSGDPFTETTYSAPDGSTHYITGLTPGAAYDVTITPNGGNVTITVRPGGSVTADAGGVLVTTE